MPNKNESAKTRITFTKINLKRKCPTLKKRSRLRADDIVGLRTPFRVLPHQLPKHIQTKDERKEDNG